MNSVQKELLHRLSGYLAVFIVFWAMGAIAVLWLGYEESFLLLNQLNLPWLDAIMPHYTHLGHGALVSLIFILIASNLEIDLVIALIISLLLVAVAVGVGKHYFFSDWDRPLAIFKAKQFHFISLTPDRLNAFPSGHSAVAATAFFFVAAHMGKTKPYWGILWALIALLACYSRLYIGVHFLGDIVVGSMIGVGLSWGGYFLIKKLFGKKLAGIEGSKKGLILKWVKIFAGLILVFDLYVLFTHNYL